MTKLNYHQPDVKILKIFLRVNQYDIMKKVQDISGEIILQDSYIYGIELKENIHLLPAISNISIEFDYLIPEL